MREGNTRSRPRVKVTTHEEGDTRGEERSMQSVCPMLDCKAVRIFAYSSKREQSNERSGTRLKTESETGERRYRRVRLASFARVRLVRHALPISFLILRKKPDCFAVQSNAGHSLQSLVVSCPSAYHLLGVDFTPTCFSKVIRFLTRGQGYWGKDSGTFEHSLCCT